MPSPFSTSRAKIKLAFSCFTLEPGSAISSPLTKLPRSSVNASPSSICWDRRWRGCPPFGALQSATQSQGRGATPFVPFEGWVMTTLPKPRPSRHQFQRPEQPRQNTYITVRTNRNHKMFHVEHFSILWVSSEPAPGDWLGQDKFSARFNVPRSFWIFCCSSVMAWINCSGRGGQPGTYTSTGITWFTLCTRA